MHVTVLIYFNEVDVPYSTNNRYSHANAWMDFHEICRISSAWNKEHSGTFFRCSMQPSEHRNSLWDSVPVSNIAKKKTGWINFHEIVMLNGMSDMKQSGKFWRMLFLTRWILDLWFYFLDPCLLVTLQTRETFETPKHPRRRRDQYTAPNSKYIGAECSLHPPPPKKS